MNLTLLTWNARGISSSAACIGHLLSMPEYQSDIVILSEANLCAANVDILDRIHERYYGIPRTSNDVSPELLRHKVVALIKKDLFYSVSIPDNVSTDRLIAVQLHTDDTEVITILGVYMPSNNNLQEYDLILQQLRDAYSYYSRSGKVILCGDFNARINENPHYPVLKHKSSAIKEVIADLNLIPLNFLSSCKGYRYTFVPSQTTLDYILTDKTFAYNYVNYCEIFSTPESDISSDHLPIICTFNMPIKRYWSSRTPLSCDSRAWNKATINDLINYQLELTDTLNGLLDMSLDTQYDIDTYAEIMTLSAIISANNRILMKNHNLHLKPYWSPEVKSAHKNALRKRALCISEGRPRGMQHPSYKSYKDAKKVFKEVHEHAYDAFLLECQQELERTAEADIRLFWKVIRRRKSVKNRSVLRVSL
ncbi:uncharacterized protein LOC117343283 [Pecten maximus]|uniref:uncharacterized protein LOC117343283 n=1 Tax=Pecten maximus TaxID=6579 RepID=UPI001458059E|nr:uncharacterized protein LOC117343283 [Pecten maximus]